MKTKHFFHLIGLFSAISVCGVEKVDFCVLNEFTNPAMVSVENGSLKVQNGFACVIPSASAKEVTLTLKKKIPLKKDPVWFTMHTTKTGRGRVALRMTLENDKGKDIFSTTKTLVMGDCEWQNMVSDWSFKKIGPYEHNYPEDLKGLKVKSLKLMLNGDVKEIYFRAPVIVGGNTFDPDMLASADERAEVCYGEMASINIRRNGRFYCTLEMQAVFQENPFLVQTKLFDYSLKSSLEKAAVTFPGFTLPALPKGNYAYRLIYRDAGSSNIDRIQKGEYHVMSSPVKELPKIKKASGLYLSFIPTNADFIYKTPEVTGKICVPPITDKMFEKNKGPFRVTYALTEFTGRWYRTNVCKPQVYMKWENKLDRNGGEIDLNIAIDRNAVVRNKAFYLELELFDAKQNKLASNKYIIGIRGSNDAYKPMAGKRIEWQEALSGDILTATGLASITLPDPDLRTFIHKIKYQGAYKIYLADGGWTQETEPLKGFYSYDYLERAIRYATNEGLRIAIQIGGIHNDPEWARFEYEPARANDGRFLSSHYNSISIWGKSPMEYIRKHMENTVKRYAGVPNLSYWKCWCYEGEGFTTDWWYMWMFGDIRSGYCVPGIKHYQDFVQKKYKTVANLNKAYQTNYKTFSEVIPPEPVKNRILRDRLRNPEPLFDPAYADFEQMKQDDFTEYWESFVFTKLRSLDPGRLFAVYYYPDSEGGEKASKGVFARNPGLLKHNGGFSGIDVFNNQAYYYGIYEGLSGMMSEDGGVWVDTIDDWLREVYGTARFGGRYANYFNYSIYQTRGADIELERQDKEKSTFFCSMQKEFFPKIRKMERIPSRFAVYSKYYDNYHNHIWPLGDLFFSRYQAEPICYKYLDRLEKYYDVLAMDSGANVLSESEMDQIVSWVKKGGTLITTPAIGAWSDEMIEKKKETSLKDWDAPLSHPNRLLDKLGLPLPKDGKWGTQIEGRFSADTISKEYFPNVKELYFKNAFSPIQDQLNIDKLGDREKAIKNGYSIYVFPKDGYPQGEVLARFNSPAAVKDYPAMYEFKVGKGKVILFSQYPQVDDTAFWYGICDKLGIPRDISFAGKDSDKDIYFRWTNGYMLSAADGSYLISTIQHPNKDSYRYTWRPTDEKAPYFRRVRAHHLKKGDYRVEMFKNGIKSELGIFTSKALDEKGIPYSYSECNEVISFYLEPVKSK